MCRFFIVRNEKLKQIEKAYKKSVSKRLVDLYQRLVRRTNFGDTKIFFNGKLHSLKPGQVFFTKTEFAELYDVHRNTITSDLERLNKVEPFITTISKSNHSGGVIITWLNYKEMQNPSKKFSKDGRSHQNKQYSKPSKLCQSRDTEQPYDSGSHQNSHLIPNLANPNESINSLNNTKNIITPPTVSDERRELVNYFKKLFPRLTVSKAQQETFFHTMQFKGWTNSKAKAVMEEFVQNIVYRELLWGLGGLFEKKYRAKDKLKIDKFVAAQLKDVWEDHEAPEKPIQIVFQQVLHHLDAQHDHFKVQITKGEFYAAYKTEIDNFIAMYQVKAEETKKSELVESLEAPSVTGSDLDTGSESGSENPSGSETGSDLETGSESEKITVKQPTEEFCSESELEKPDLSEGAELESKTENEPNPSFNGKKAAENNDPDFDHDVGLNKSKILSLIKAACDEKSLTTSLYKAGMKSSAQEYRFKDKYYQAVHEKAELLWNKKMHDYIQLGFASSEPEFKRKFSKKYPFPYFRRKRQEQLVNFEKLIGRVA